MREGVWKVAIGQTFLMKTSEDNYWHIFTARSSFVAECTLLSTVDLLLPKADYTNSFAPFTIRVQPSSCIEEPKHFSPLDL